MNKSKKRAETLPLTEDGQNMNNDSIWTVGGHPSPINNKSSLERLTYNRQSELRHVTSQSQIETENDNH